MGLDSNNMERLVVSGVYGPGDLITDVMKLIYNLNVYNGSNKLTLINDKALVRTNIRKKNVLNIVLEKSNKCNELSNKFKVFSGDSGSLFIGFFISFMTIELYNNFDIHPSILIWPGNLMNLKGNPRIVQGIPVEIY